MKDYFTIENCFTDRVPTNADEIIEFLNAEAKRRGVNTFEPDDAEVADIVGQIWEEYCNGEIGPRWILEGEEC